MRYACFAFHDSAQQLIKFHDLNDSGSLQSCSVNLSLRFAIEGNWIVLAVTDFVRDSLCALPSLQISPRSIFVIVIARFIAVCNYSIVEIFPNFCFVIRFIARRILFQWKICISILTCTMQADCSIHAFQGTSRKIFRTKFRNFSSWLVMRQCIYGSGGSRTRLVRLFVRNIRWCVRIKRVGM